MPLAQATRCRSGQIKSKRDVSSALIMAMMKRQVFDRRGVSPLHRAGRAALLHFLREVLVDRRRKCDVPKTST